MDILYSLGKGSKWNNSELIFSLRSIAKFGKNVGKVYVVGYNPGFLSDEVIFIPIKGSYDAKEKNILEAIVYAVKNSDIGEEFLYSSDDHFYVKETDFDNYPYFCKGELRTTFDKYDRARRYHKCLIDTRKLLFENGYSTYNFSWHGNTHFSKEGIKKAIPLIEKSYQTKYGCEPTCLVLNTIYSTINTFPIIDRKDLKVKNIQGVNDLIQQIGDRECFSIYDKSIGNGVGDYLRQLFPQKCKYEK